MPQLHRQIGNICRFAKALGNTHEMKRCPLRPAELDIQSFPELTVRQHFFDGHTFAADLDAVFEAVADHVGSQQSFALRHPEAWGPLLREDLGRRQPGVTVLRSVLRPEGLVRDAEFASGEAGVLTRKTVPWSAAHLYHVPSGKWVGRPFRPEQVGHGPRGFSPDGKRYLLIPRVTLGESKLWDADQGRLVGWLPGVPRKEDFNADGTLLLVISYGLRSEGQLWDVNTGRRAPLPEGVEGPQVALLKTIFPDVAFHEVDSGWFRIPGASRPSPPSRGIASD